ncbi:DUF1737 domain-containing protein [Thioflexithrix psekupsensis]|uniref:DUF1737 domain-containing protein n=1 Tax=Thioflexithrix psekupsensis TaxID=1570016 RepID=A0A251XC70_9GAMM|nr:DUF1737 domain-containing protein [Thioflexithrix psekupsensis]OUD16326.1 hypothetical protein TPSD3_00980 [Thioflexithrix psekupsensis]
MKYQKYRLITTVLPTAHLEANLHSTFEKTTNDLIAKGWQLHGQVSVSFHGDSVCYAQGMVQPTE